MIEPMYTYTFLVPETDYLGFLRQLRRLGVVHVRQRNEALPPGVQERLEDQKTIQEVLAVLEHRDVPPATPQSTDRETGLQLLEAYDQWTEQLDDLEQELEEVRAAYQYWQAWGSFRGLSLQELREEGLYVRFFQCPVRQWQQDWIRLYPLGIIRQTRGEVLCIGLETEQKPVNWPEVLEPWPQPETGTQELAERLTVLEEKRQELNEQLDHLAATGQPAIRATLHELQDEIQFKQVIQQTRQEVDEQVMVLEGFAPGKRRADLEAWLEQEKKLYLRRRARPDDAPPVLLRNSRFARLFEPISELFSLPEYAELDLTPYFAPFFMLFFGFCVGDAGYGIVMVLGAGLYQLRAPEEQRSILRLIQWLGVATILFGALTGTVFGLNLITNPIAGLESLRQYMLDSDQMFNLALVLGVVQILFGLVLQAINQYRQYGWAWSVVPVAWMILLISLVDIGLLKMVSPWSTYTAWTAVGLILLFSNPSATLAGRIGQGLWELYGITGFFGDLLSYIRLFALGISSAILGYVVNNIAFQLNGSIPYLGPVLFVLFLVVGHGANLLIASLGAFVHPMRLTFVEFYKNAGFKGGGRAYDPLREHSTDA